MIIYLQGINIAFIPRGQAIGTYLGILDRRWLLVPFGFMVGFLATYAEPAVRVLCYQIEKSSSGFIRGSLILYTLSIGGAVSVSLGMARIVYGIPFSSIILAGYGLSLLLLVFSDKDFIAIAFDSGGVATGPRAVSFLASLAVGATVVMDGRNPIADAFGLIALVALAPILSVLILGTLFRFRKVHVHDA